MGKQVSLHLKCMSCGKSLMDYKNLLNNLPSVLCNITCKGKNGKIWLCSTYGCYDHKSNIEIPNEEVVTFTCPHCNEVLNTSIKCQVCESSMVKFNIEIGGVVSICSRRGCKNHYVMFEDIESAIRKFHSEYGM